MRPTTSSSYSKGRAWIEIDRESLRHNAAVLLARLPPGCALMPAVKANAYGHGAEFVAKELQALGVGAFCVATAQEGVELRRHHIRGDILVLGYTHPRQMALLRRYRLTQTVADYAYAEQLNGFGRPLRVHIGIDTGMHRLGERCENIDRIARIFQMDNLRVDGLLTHLYADYVDGVWDRAYTAAQARAFYRVVRQLEERGLPRPAVHLLNSYGLLHYPELGGDFARAGIALYGAVRDEAELRPVLSLRARIISVRELHKGESAGYGPAFTADKEMRIAAVAVGYADGLPRSLSCGAGGVLINGKPAPIIGRICMDQTLVDVTGLPAVEAGTVATVIGRSGDKAITACDVADQAHTIPNEILSRLGERLERLVV